MINIQDFSTDLFWTFWKKYNKLGWVSMDNTYTYRKLERGREGGLVL